jgi:uncharacterized membrane protein YphA (DoxX/SURF4 family)
MTAGLLAEMENHGCRASHAEVRGSITFILDRRETMTAKVVGNPTVRYAKGIVLIRVLVGWVFLSEGIQKFLFPAALGAGRFAKIGILAPQVMAPFVGAVEIGCGVLILIGLFTRWAALPLLAVIVVALFTTKLPLLVKDGIWSALHEARTDLSMVLGLLFLLIAGGGSIALDATLSDRHVGGSSSGGGAASGGL